MYNQTMVTIKPKAPYHSMNLGAPLSAPCSIISKSMIKFNAAIATTNKLMPMLNKTTVVHEANVHAKHAQYHGDQIERYQYLM
jgi:hypothetical protein